MNDQEWNARVYDQGGREFNLFNSTFGGVGDGTTTEDDAILNALDLVPEGAVIKVPPTVKIDGVWQRTQLLIDSVDLTITPKENITLDLRGVLLKKKGAATEGGTASHMFKDTAGVMNGLRVLGGEFDLNRAEFTNGDVVSAFQFIRTDDLTFLFNHIRDGIEEGIKMYKCINVLGFRTKLANIRNNGVQFHTPDEGAQYTGVKDDRGSDGLWWTHSVIEDIDDGLEGTFDGQAFAVVAGSTTLTTKNAWIMHNIIRRCIRGPWAEFNFAGQPGENIHFDHNIIEENRWHGVGIIGGRGCSINHNKIVNIGVMAPIGGSTSSEVLGCILSGSTARGEDNHMCNNTVLEKRTGAAAFFEYGVTVKNNDRATVVDNNVEGEFTIRKYNIEWGTGKVLNCRVERQLKPMVTVTLAVTQAIPDATFTNFAPDTQIVDSEEDIGGAFGMWAVANPDLMVFRTPGYYRIGANIVFPTNGTGKRILRIYTTDGTTPVLEDEDIDTNPDTAEDCTLSVESAIIQVTEAQIDSALGRWTLVQIYQDSGAPMNLAVGNKVNMWAQYVGPNV